MVGAFSGGGLGFGLAFQLRDEFSQSAARIQQSMSGLEGAAAALAGNVTAAMNRMQAGFALVVAGGAILAPIWKGINAAGDMEQTSIAFEVMLKDVDLAKKTLLDLRKFADVTPFEDKPVIESGQMLVAYGKKAKDLIPTLTVLGNVAAGVGMDIKELSEIYGKNLMQPKIMTRDIYQFAGRGIPIIKALAEVLGVANDQVMAMAEKGKIGVPAMEEAFKRMGSGAGMYAGLMDRQSQSFKGRMSTIASYFGQIFEFAGNAIMPFAKKAQDAIGALTEKIKNFIQTPFGKTIVQIATALGVMLVVLGAAMILTGAYRFVVLKLAGSFAAQAASQLIATIATKGYAAGLWAAARASWALISPTLMWVGAALAIYYIGKKLLIWDRLGSIFSGLAEVWSSFDSSKGIFQITEATRSQLATQGVLDTVLSLGTWLIRLKVLLGGVWDGFITGVVAVKTGIDWILVHIPLLSLAIGKNTTDIETYGKVGQWVGYSLAAAFTAWGLRSLWAFAVQIWGWVKSSAIAMYSILTLKTGLLSLGTAMWASLGLIGLAVIMWQKFGVVGKIVAGIIGGLVIAWWAWTAANWALNAALYSNPLVWIIALIVLGIAIVVALGVAIYYLIAAIVDNWDVITKWFEDAYNAVGAFFAGIIDWIEGVWDMGVQFVQNLWGGNKSFWQQIIDWIGQKVQDIGAMIATPFKAVAEWLGLTSTDGTMNVNQSTAPGGGTTTAGDVKTANRGVSSFIPPYGQNAPQSSTQPLVVHTNLHIDGAPVAKVVNQYNRNEQGRGGDYGE